jgi:hypothetical protein
MLSAMLSVSFGDGTAEAHSPLFFTDLADFATVSVWLGSRLFVVAMSKAQN